MDESGTCAGSGSSFTLATQPDDDGRRCNAGVCCYGYQVCYQASIFNIGDLSCRGEETCYGSSALYTLSGDMYCSDQAGDTTPDPSNGQTPDFV